MRNPLIALASVVALSLGLTACADAPLAAPAPESSEPTASATPTETADPNLPSNEDIESLIEAIASRNASDLAAANDLVMEGSHAAGYLTYFAHNTNAQIDAGLSGLIEPSKIRELENGFETCENYDGEQSCTSYTDFEGEDGLITNFKVQDRNLADRLSVGTGKTLKGPDESRIEFVAAYMNAADTHLLVAYNVRSGESETSLPLSSYRGRDGRQSQSEVHYGAWSLAPDSMSSYISMFPGAQLGGEMHLEIMTENTWDMETVVVPITEE